MAPPFRLLLSKDGVRTTIGKLELQQILVGREPADGYLIPSEAVSREHGIFLSFDRHWYFKDLGSSNGSWINGRPLLPNKLNLVKVGDVIQLADSLLEIATVEPGDPIESSTSVIVFRRGDFQREFSLVEQGPLVTFGGSSGDLKLDETELDLAGLVIERRGSDLTASLVSKRLPVTVNGIPLDKTAILRDRDVLTCGPYEIFISIGDDITIVRKEFFSIQESNEEESKGARIEDWEEEEIKRTPVNPMFGKAATRHSTMHATAIMSDGHRDFSENDEDKKTRKLDAIENLLIVGTGGILLLLVVGATIYWITSQ